jgi:spermidine synthase
MVRVVALLLTVITGFTGLVYQVTWQRYLATLLGSHAEATAAVLGLFLGGLSIGYAVFGAVTSRLVERAASRGDGPRLLLVYGAVEASIGVWALAFPLLFAGVQGLSLWLPLEGGFVTDVLLCALLIAPPTILMGGTIPVLTQALSHAVRDASRIHALVYGLNTVGAFAGTLTAGFWLLAWLGLGKTLVAMAVLNLLAGLAFALLDRRDATPRPEAMTAAVAERVEGFASYAAVALLSGFAMMTLEVVLIRFGGLSLGSSEYSFSMVVAVFVLCIAIGSLLVSVMPRIPTGLLLGNQILLVAILVALYRVMPDLPYAAYVLRTIFTRADAAFHPFYLLSFLGLLAVIGLPVALSGATLPLVFDHVRRRHGDLGAVAGRLYSWNTIGSLAGALLGGYALLFWLDLHHVYRIAVGALALGVVLLVLQLRGRAIAAGLGAAAVAFALLLGFAPWPSEHLSAGLYRARELNARSYAGADTLLDWVWAEREILFYDDDPTTTVSVVEVADDDGSYRFLALNGKPDSATRLDTITTGLLAHLPALFAESPRRGFVIGFGTGVTAGELAQLDSIEEVVVAEISPGVVRAAPYFAEANHDALEHPKVRVVRSDAYRALLRGDHRYDVITSEPSNPWVTGVEMLYSREFLEAARGRLEPGGVYCQWLQQYELDTESLLLVLRTYASVFPHVAIWYGMGPDLLLLGFEDPDAAVDVERLAARAALPDYAEGLRRAGIESFPALLAHELLPLGVVHAVDLPGPLQTLHHPRLNHMAGRAFFRRDLSTLPFTGFGEAAVAGARNSLFRRYIASLPDGLTDAILAEYVGQACDERGRQCTTLLGYWAGRDASSERLARELSAVRQQAPRYGGRVDRRIIPQLVAWLYGSAGSEQAIDAQTGASVTGLYQHFYQHAVPFESERLLGVWERCQPGGEGCEAGRAQARAMLTGEPAASDVGRAASAR